MQPDVDSWTYDSRISGTSLQLEPVHFVAYKNEDFVFPPYNPIQIEAVKELALNILQ